MNGRHKVGEVIAAVALRAFRRPGIGNEVALVVELRAMLAEARRPWCRFVGK